MRLAQDAGIALEWFESFSRGFFNLIRVDLAVAVFCGKAGSVLARALAEDQKIGKRVAAQSIGPVYSCRAFACGKESPDGGHLRFGIDADASHDVVRSWADFHRLMSDIDVGKLFELMIHARKFSPYMLGGVWKFFFYPGDVEINSPVLAPAPLFDFADDAAGDVIASEQFGRTPRASVALSVAPAFFGIVGGLAAIVFGNLVEHETASFFIYEDAAFAPHAFGYEYAANARRPDHSRRMELNELHID